MGLKKESIQKIQELIPAKDPHCMNKLEHNLTEAFRRENTAGTWTKKQLQQMETEFNNLNSNKENERRVILFRFFHATQIFHICIDGIIVVSEYAYQRDLFKRKTDLLNYADIRSKYLGEFSNLHFGPSPKTKIEALHDAHVKTATLAKIPQCYQPKYPIETKLTASVELFKVYPEKYAIQIKYLKKNEDTCRHINTLQPLILHSIPIKNIQRIKMHQNNNGTQDLFIKSWNLA